jgi:DNA-directed RNA polymerase specialized sigma24 family protein
MIPIAPLRRIAFSDEIAKGYEIDVDAARFERKDRYHIERKVKFGVVSISAMMEGAYLTGEEGDKKLTRYEEWKLDFETRLIFWDALRAVDRETALYLVLRFCLGYSASEVAAGLDVGFARVKYLTSKAMKLYDKQKAADQLRERRQEEYTRQLYGR